jgi:hypothetical protein
MLWSALLPSRRIHLPARLYSHHFPSHYNGKDSKFSMPKKSPNTPGKASGSQGKPRMGAAITPAAARVIAAALQQGLALHQAGNLDQARAIYEEIVRINPRNFDALQLLATIAAQTGEYEKAVELFTRVLAVHSNNAALFNNRGVALFELKRLDEALASYARAIAIKPDYAEAHYNRGNAFKQHQLLPDALASYERAIACKPDYAQAYANRGNVLKELGLAQEALASFERAIEFQPGYAEAHGNRGVCLHDIGRTDEAVASYERAISIDAAYAEAHSNLGVSLMALERLPQALASYARAIALKPDYAQAHYNRGNAFHELHLPEEAIASFERAIAIQPDYAQAHYNCGNTFKELRHLDKALAHYAAAIAAQPDYAQAHCNQGVALQELQRLEDAVASYGRAIAIQPDYAEARWNQSLALLQLGDFQAGWAFYEWRWACAASAGARRNFVPPLWLGHGSLVNKTLLLHAEQGLGDAIQFCRYTQSVKDAGACVLLEVPGALMGLLAQLPGVDQLIERGTSLPSFDYHCPLMSLPLAFGTTVASIPAQGAYLHADAAKVRHWRDKIGGRGRLKVGVIWNGGFRPKQPELWSTNARRNIPLDIFARAFSAIEADFFSLQKGDPAESAIRGRELEYWPQGNFFNFATELNDFSDTAALIDTLDIIVSVDTATAHAAAALGKPTWILNRFDSCWRWLRDRDDSPWYPSVRLYRQQIDCHWEPVLQRVADDLSRLKPAQ